MKTIVAWLAVLMLSASMAAAVVLPGSAVVSSIAGDVQSLEAGKWVPVKAGQVFKAGTEIKTGAKSSATLALTTGALVQILENSSLALNSLSRSANEPSDKTAKSVSDLMLKHGAVLVQFGAPGTGSIFKVQTQFGFVLAEQKADFAVAATAADMEAHCMKGKIQIVRVKGLVPRDLLEGQMGMLNQAGEYKSEATADSNLNKVYQQFVAATQGLAPVLTSPLGVDDVKKLTPGGSDAGGGAKPDFGGDAPAPAQPSPGDLTDVSPIK